MKETIESLVDVAHYLGEESFTGKVLIVELLTILFEFAFEVGFLNILELMPETLNGQVTLLDETEALVLPDVVGALLVEG